MHPRLLSPVAVVRITFPVLNLTIETVGGCPSRNGLPVILTIHRSEGNDMCRMRTYVISLGLFLGSASSLICGMAAENRALAAQADPIQAGYVIITPIGDNTSGLMAFETFGQKEGPGSTQAGVLPATMTKNALLFVNTSGRLSRNLGVAIANPETRTSTSR